MAVGLGDLVFEVIRLRGLSNLLWVKGAENSGDIFPLGGNIRFWMKEPIRAYIASMVDGTFVIAERERRSPGSWGQVPNSWLCERTCVSATTNTE